MGISGRRAAPLRNATALLAAAFLMSGCAVLGGGPAPLDTFDLTAPGSERRVARARTQVLVPEPTAIKALDGENIVVRTAPNAIEFLAGAQWADRLPRVVQARLAESLQKSGRFGGVGKPGEGLAIDYQVMVEIRAFEIRADGSQRAVVQLFARILNDRNGVVRASRLFEAAVPVSGSGNEAFIGALDRAFGSVADQIVGWTAGSI
jgi:cholesterol transport system auxiliary component